MLSFDGKRNIFDDYGSWYKLVIISSVRLVAAIVITVVRRVLIGSGVSVDGGGGVIVNVIVTGIVVKVVGRRISGRRSSSCLMESNIAAVTIWVIWVALVVAAIAVI